MVHTITCAVHSFREFLYKSFWVLCMFSVGRYLSSFWWLIPFLPFCTYYIYISCMYPYMYCTVYNNGWREHCLFQIVKLSALSNKIKLSNFLLLWSFQFYMNLSYHIIHTASVRLPFLFCNSVSIHCWHTHSISSTPEIFLSLVILYN